MHTNLNQSNEDLIDYVWLNLNEQPTSRAQTANFLSPTSPKAPMAFVRAPGSKLQSLKNQEQKAQSIIHQNQVALNNSKYIHTHHFQEVDTQAGKMDVKAFAFSFSSNQGKKLAVQASTHYKDGIKGSVAIENQTFYITTGSQFGQNVSKMAAPSEQRRVPIKGIDIEVYSRIRKGPSKRKPANRDARNSNDTNLIVESHVVQLNQRPSEMHKLAANEAKSVQVAHSAPRSSFQMGKVPLGQEPISFELGSIPQLDLIKPTEDMSPPPRFKPQIHRPGKFFNSLHQTRYLYNSNEPANLPETKEKVFFDSNATQAMQRGSSNYPQVHSGLIPVQKNSEILQQPLQLTKVVVAVTKDGADHSDNNKLLYQQKDSQVGPDGDAPREPRLQTTCPPSDYQSKALEILLPKFDMEALTKQNLNDSQLHLNNESLDSCTKRQQTIESAGDRKVSQKHSIEQQSDVLSYNTAENDFAMIVRGINSLINNAATPSQHENEKFTRVIRRAQVQALQTGQFPESHPATSEHDTEGELGIQGVSKDIKRKSTIKETRLSNQRRANQQRTLSSMMSPERAINAEIGNYTMREESQGRTPTSFRVKKVNEDLKPMQKDDIDSLYQRHLLSALDRAKEFATEAERQITPHISILNEPQDHSRNQQTLMQTENSINNQEKTAMTFGESRQFNSLLASKPYSPKNMRRGGTQAGHKRDTFNVQIENKPPRMNETVSQFLQGQTQRAEDPVDYHAILPQQHVFEKKTKSSHTGQRKQLLQQQRISKISEVPSSLQQMLVGSRQLQESVSFFHARMTSKNSFADSKNPTQSRFYSLPRGQSFAETQQEQGWSVLDDQARETTHQKRHLNNEILSQRAYTYKTHHKGLWQMADICSQRVKGIKVSRLARPVDFDKEQVNRALSDMHRPSIAQSNYQAIHNANIEVNLQQQALIDFKAKQSAFHRATKTQRIPMGYLNNAAAQFEVSSPSPRRAKTNKQFQQRIQKVKEGLERETPMLRNQLSLKAHVFEVLFPQVKEANRKVSIETRPATPQSPNLKAIISSLGQNNENSRQSQQLMLVSNQTQISNKVISQSIFMDESNIRDSHYKKQQTLQKESQDQSQRLRSIRDSDTRRIEPADAEKACTAKSQSTRIIITQSRDLTLHSKKSRSKSPKSSTPHSRSILDEKESTNSEVQDSQLKLQPIKIDRSEVQQASQDDLEGSSSSPVMEQQKMTLGYSLEQSPRQVRELSSSVAVHQMNAVIGVTQIKIVRSQKSDAELGGKSSLLKKSMDLGNHIGDQTAIKPIEPHVFKNVGERSVEGRSSTKRLESPQTLERQDYGPLKQSIKNVKNKSSIKIQMQVGGNSISSKGLKTQVLNSFNGSAFDQDGILSMDQNKDLSDVAEPVPHDVISPTYSALVTDKLNVEFKELPLGGGGKKETDRNMMLKRMLNQVGLTQLKPKVYEIQMSDQQASVPHSDSENEALDVRSQATRETTRIVKGLCLNQKPTENKERTVQPQNKKRRKALTTETKIDVPSTQQEDCIKVQTLDVQLPSPVNLLKLFQVLMTKDGLKVTPTTQNLLEQLQKLQGFQMDGSKIKFNIGPESVQNRVLVNQYSDEAMLMKDSWLKRFEPNELQTICMPLAGKRRKTYTELEISSTEEAESATGVTYSQLVLQKIAESQSGRCYFAKFTSIRISVISEAGFCHSIGLPFCYMTRLFLLGKDQLQSLLSKCLVVVKDYKGQRFAVDYDRLGHLLSTSEYMPRAEREHFNTLKLKAIFYFERLGEHITMSQFELIVEMPCFEILAQTEAANQDQAKTSSFAQKDLKCRRLLQHFLTVNDLAKLLQSSKLTSWEPLMESMISNGNFGGNDVSEGQEYLLQLHPLRCKLAEPDLTISVKDHALMKLQYVTPYVLELKTYAEEVNGDLVLAAMELLPKTLELLVGLFGEEFASDDGPASLTECASSIVNVFADAEQGVFALEVVDWSMLEQIQLLKVSRMVANKKQEMKPWLTKMPLKEGSLPGYLTKNKRAPQKPQSEPKDVNQPEHANKTTILLNGKIPCNLRVKPALMITQTKDCQDIKPITANELINF